MSALQPKPAATSRTGKRRPRAKITRSFAGGSAISRPKSTSSLPATSADIIVRAWKILLQPRSSSAATQRPFGRG